MTKQIVNITIDKEIMESIRQFCNKQEFPPTLSAFFSKAADNYLKIHLGIPYITRFKK